MQPNRRAPCHRGAEAVGRVPTMAVSPGLLTFDEVQPGLCSPVVAYLMDALDLLRLEETFRRRVVPGISPRAHGAS